MQEFHDFATAHGITLKATRLPSRDKWDANPDIPNASHFHVVLTKGDRTLWSGEYSQGIGHAEGWAKKNVSKFFADRVGQAGHGFPMTDALRNGPGRGKSWRSDSNYWDNVRNRYAHAVETQKPGKEILTPGEILLSLQMDICGCDQAFEHWADDLGYSSDSIKAKSIWEACNDTRRTLQRELGTGPGGSFEAFTELEE